MTETSPVFQRLVAAARELQADLKKPAHDEENGYAVWVERESAPPVLVVYAWGKSADAIRKAFSERQN